jgi:hypothetical protein
MKIPIVTTLLAASALAGCASTTGARPSDMSTAQHEQAAGALEAQAATHEAQYAPGATGATECHSYEGCWSSSANPTQQHKQEAEKLRKMASDHRAASQALRDAEARACGGLSNDDRDISPFEHREDIASVQPAYGNLNLSGGKQPTGHLVGADVTFRAVPGMTAEWLQRLVDCHIARNNALGNDVPEMPYCPLVPKGITAKVSSAGNGFTVRIESQDVSTANEVLRRAQSLKNPG